MIGISDDTLRKAHRHYVFEAIFFGVLIAVSFCIPDAKGVLVSSAGLAIVAARALINGNRVAKVMDDRELN